jgi:hypothetical protein
VQVCMYLQAQEIRCGVSVPVLHIRSNLDHDYARRPMRANPRKLRVSAAHQEACRAALNPFLVHADGQSVAVRDGEAFCRAPTRVITGTKRKVSTPKVSTI